MGKYTKNAAKTWRFELFVAILWGIFIWKEFNDADIATRRMLGTMFSLYIFGLVLITVSNI